MDRILHDVRHSLRMLAKSPLLTVTAIGTLALGIGLNSATFSVIHGLLLRPLGGVESPEELIQVYRKRPGLDYGASSIPHYQDIRDRGGEVFESTAAWTSAPVSLSAEGQSERLMGVLASANLFTTLGVRPEIGRGFMPEAEAQRPGAHPVAVLGHSFWRSRFGSDPAVLGQTLILNGTPFEVVGVAPPDFKGPMPAIDVPIYVPIMMQAQIMPGKNLLESRDESPLVVIARLRSDRTLEQARIAMDRVLVQLEEEFPEAYRGQLGATLITLTEAGLHPSFRGAALGMSTVMMAVVLLLLLIACVNVANLFLARARERRQEMGIRISLGASGRALVQQLLTESLIFSLLAGAAGVALAFAVTGLLTRFELPVDGSVAFDFRIDTTVLVFTLAVSVAAGLAFGMAPALQATRTDFLGARQSGSGQRGGRLRPSRALIVLQMALSLILLVSSGLFLRALQAATEIDPGIDAPRNVIMASMDPGLQGYEEAQARQFFDRLLERLAARSDVTFAGLTNSVPLGFHLISQEVEVPGYEFAEGERSSVYYAAVTEGILESLGIDLEEGRTFLRSDDSEAQPVAVINRRFAERFWPNGTALGQTVRTAGADRRIVGIVETAKYRSLGEPPTEYLYLPQRELFQSAMTLLVRTEADPRTVLAGVRETVHSLDPDLPLYEVRTMEEHMGIALLPARLGGVVLGLFGLLGLLLTAVGIYGVFAYSVVQRRRELGIRVALGAGRSRVEGLVLKEGLRLAATGLAIGLAGAAGAAQLLRGMLYSIRPIDPAVFATVSLILMALAALAVYLPARRASRMDPIRALAED
ncbi:MAG: ABC transporter permease [Acidobacteriota bacterium]